MSTKLENGVLTISALYGVTVNRGDFSSEKLSMQVGIAFDVEGDSSVAFAEAEAQQKLLDKQVKLAVIEGLGMDAKVDESGTFLADFKSAPKAAPAPVAAPAAPAVGSYSGGSEGFKPKADISGNPRFAADLDGTGPKLWIDLRPTKASGAFKAGAADFRDSEDSKHQVWLANKDGSVKDDVAQALTTAGVAV